MNYRITQLTNISMGKINQVYLPPSSKLEITNISTEYFLIIDKNKIFAFNFNDEIPRGCIALNKIQREYLNKSLHSDSVNVDIIRKSALSPISLLRLSVEIINKDNREIERNKFVEIFKNMYLNFPFNKNQCFYFYEEYYGYKVTVSEILTVGEKDYGVLLGGTNVYVVSSGDRLTFIGNCGDNLLLKPDFNFESLGIGGLKKEFGIMFRRAFVQRVFTPEIIQRLGIQHVKGIMLYGPPGTGKTLIARQIGSLLNARPPKIVNGPEILNKYVGQSEENIRNLFLDAEEEYKKKKEKSSLHIIIFDEIDAICKSRGTSGSSGIGDQVVNQLLSKMDGVESLDNVLIIGMTNRLDLIDKALLRPGRFEIHIEISLPDEESRYEIFKIHTKQMEKSDFLETDVNLHELAKVTRNYTGAEITALVKSAVSYALERKVHEEKKDENIKIVGENNIKVTMTDFMMALEEVKPAFGVNEEEFSSFKKVYYELPSFTAATEIGSSFLTKVKTTNLYNTSSLLYFGSPGSGKTTIAVRVALNSGFPFIKVISPKDMVGLNEYEKVNFIKDKFYDAYKSEYSIILLDDIEGLIDFVGIGPRFSNSILQAIKIFIKTEAKNRLFVFGTASSIEVVRECGIYDCFYGHCEIKDVDFDDFERLSLQNKDFSKIRFEGNCPIKKLLSLLEFPDISNE
ncbi:Cdc48-like ATPase [Hamiltosporidium tvaerminnensis]|uniref:Vesicular-fusion protein SEC18 n=1 Tax=Hamiltosporidium tvaerminnensis TaxID=1176355 RepID=A0A4Q9LQC3_9MICR|nr:Cdc48-like ATPase [Hamiltosporidium tvaerminnensis]